MVAPEHTLTVQLSSASSIDSASGVLRGVTVAEIGTATGHFAFLDAANKVVCVGGAKDAPQGVPTKRVPLCMDAKSIETVVAAGKQAVRVKAREDHDDSIGSRAGYVENFRLEGGKAVCDVTVFGSYRNRGVFLETAATTPELIGLSGDFKFNAEVIGECVMMRVTRVDAVDIVDQGALTHAGLFKAKAQEGVDMKNKETPPPSSMAKASEAPDLKAFKALCESVAAYRAANAAATAEIDECMASLAPSKPSAAPADETPVMSAAVLSALKTDLTKELSATFKTQADEIATKAVSAAQVEFKKQLSALGIKPKETPALSAQAPAASTTTEVAKDFLTLKASVAKERNIKPSEAARIIMIEQPEVYRAHQVKLGILKA